jgi:hypothetical protein
MPDQLDRRGLAVGARHGDHLVGDQPPAQLDFADHGHPRLPRSGHDRGLRRHAGALDHGAHAGQQLDPGRAGVDRDPGRLELRAPRLGDRPRVAARDGLAAPAQREPRRDARAGQPHDQIGTGWERRPREHAGIVSEGSER